MVSKIRKQKSKERQKYIAKKLKVPTVCTTSPASNTLGKVSKCADHALQQFGTSKVRRKRLYDEKCYQRQKCMNSSSELLGSAEGNDPNAPEMSVCISVSSDVAENEKPRITSQDEGLFELSQKQTPRLMQLTDGVEHLMIEDQTTDRGGSGAFPAQW